MILLMDLSYFEYDEDKIKSTPELLEILDIIKQNNEENY